MDENCKTVFVLDHTPYFGIAGEGFEFLNSIKKIELKQSSILKKSLWTSCVESTLEYSRIVWDLFPTGKLIRFVISDKAAHIVNTWNAHTQTMSHVSNAMV